MRKSIFRLSALRGLGGIAFLNLIFLCQCKNPSTSAAKNYAYDPAFLGEAFTVEALKVTLAPPIKWENIPLNNASQYNKALSQSSPYRIQAGALFKSPGSTNCIMIISAIKEWPDQGRKQLEKTYKNFFDFGPQWSSITQSELNINKVSAIEIMLTGQALVHYKVLFFPDSRPPFQLDYLIPQSYFDEDMKAYVESSIASVKLS